MKTKKRGKKNKSKFCMKKCEQYSISWKSFESI